MRKYELKHNGNDYSVQLQSLSSEEAVMEINGKEYKVSISAVSEVVPEGALDSLKAATAATGAVTAPASNLERLLPVKVLSWHPSLARSWKCSFPSVMSLSRTAAVQDGSDEDGKRNQLAS